MSLYNLGFGKEQPGTDCGRANEAIEVSGGRAQANLGTSSGLGRKQRALSQPAWLGRSRWSDTLKTCRLRGVVLHRLAAHTPPASASSPCVSAGPEIDPLETPSVLPLGATQGQEAARARAEDAPMPQCGVGRPAAAELAAHEQQRNPNKPQAKRTSPAAPRMSRPPRWLTRSFSSSRTASASDSSRAHETRAELRCCTTREHAPSRRRSLSLRLSLSA